LSRKYTVAQSSLLDLQIDVQEKKRAAETGVPVREDRDVGPASGPVNIRNRGQRGLSDPETTFEATSYNATAPLEPVSSSLGAGRPATPTRGAGPSDGATSPQGERYYGRGECAYASAALLLEGRLLTVIVILGGVQNSLRKEQKKADGKKEDKPDKKEKKTGGVIRNFRNLV
jgi:hypothetical protein